MHTKENRFCLFLPHGVYNIYRHWRRQKEEVGWALASVRQPNAEGVRSETPRGRGAAGAETSAEGARVEAP